MFKSRSILVTGAGGSAGHNVCWSLRVSKDGKAVSLTGTDADRTSLELNRWIDSAYRLPNADDPHYLHLLDKIVRRHKVEAIFPQPDPEVERISRDIGKLETRVFLPDHSTVSICLDKYEAGLRWNKARLRRKPILLSRSDASIDRALRRLEFPCWIRARHGAGGLMSCLARNWKTAYHWVRFHWDQGLLVEFLAEEFLPGKDFCFMSLWRNGDLVTSMARERLSWVGQRSIGSGGTSKLNRVVHSDSVNEKALSAIRGVSPRPHGIFCVDLKESKEGSPSPTEINCRFTTNVHYLTLASIKFGRPEWNFPWLAARIVLEENIPACQPLNALPANLWFTKNIDMGYTLVEDNKWRAGNLS